MCFLELRVFQSKQKRAAAVFTYQINRAAAAQLRHFCFDSRDVKDFVPSMHKNTRTEVQCSTVL